MGREFGASRIEMPPSTVTGELYVWLQRAALAINNIPSVSYTSYATPEAAVTAAPGKMLINLAVDPNATRAWIKQSGTGNTGWAALANSGGGGVGLVSSVFGTTNRITVSPTTGAAVVDISASYAGQGTIVTVGALAAGSIVAGFGGAVFGGNVSVPAHTLVVGTDPGGTEAVRVGGVMAMGTAWTGYSPSAGASFGIKVRSTIRGLWATDLGVIQLTIAGSGTFGIGRVNGTSAAPTAVVDGDELGEYGFRGYDTVNAGTSAAALYAVARETYSASPARHAASAAVYARRIGGGAFNYWTFDSEGAFQPGSPTAANDNAQDLGVATTNRWRTGYFGTSVVAPTAQFTALPAFVAADRYVVMDSSGNLHLSALGPAL